MKKIISVIILLIILIGVYGYFINPNEFKINHYSIYNSKITEGFESFKIAHFSDFLLGSTTTTKTLEKVVEKINIEEPDIIVFTGDLIYHKHDISESEKKEIKDILNNLDCSLYKYAIIGDNDQNNINTYKEIMNESGFIILDNSSTYLFHEDFDPIRITGITDMDKNPMADSNENLAPTYEIVLTHYPDNFDSLENVDLVLAGHSLHGQINIPFYGPLLKKDGARTYISEHYTKDNTELYISNGLGTENIKFRIFNSPSINIYYLHK